MTNKALSRAAVISVLRQYIFEPLNRKTLAGICKFLVAGGYGFQQMRVGTQQLIFEFSEGRKPLRVGYACKAIVPY